VYIREEINMNTHKIITDTRPDNNSNYTVYNPNYIEVLTHKISLRFSDDTGYVYPDRIVTRSQKEAEAVIASIKAHELDTELLKVRLRRYPYERHLVDVDVKNLF